MPFTISEYRSLPLGANSEVIPAFPRAIISVGRTATTASASYVIDPDTRFVRICGNQDLHVARDVPATTDSPFVPAGSEYLISCTGTQTINYRTP